MQLTISPLESTPNVDIPAKQESKLLYIYSLYFNPRGFFSPIIILIPNSSLTYKKMMIYTKYPDGKIGEYIFKSPHFLFSFGLQENTSVEDNSKVTGHSMAICLKGKDSEDIEKRERENLWIKKFEEVENFAKDKIIEYKRQLGRPKLAKDTESMEFT